MNDGEPANDGLRVRLELLAEASRTFAQVPLGSPELFNLIARKVCEHLAESCVVRLLSDDGEWLETMALYTRAPEAMEAVRSVSGVWRHRVGDGAAGPVVATGQPVFLPVVDLEALSRSVSGQFSTLLQRFPIRSLMVVAFKAHGRILGVAQMTRTRPDWSFDREDLALAQELCDRAALALDNARLYRDAQKMIAQLQENSAELERRVQERTAALQRATEAAQAANRELEAFSYSVAHDLRAPVRTLHGFSQALLEDCGPQLDGQAREYLRFLRDGAQHLGRLIDDLLELSRVARVELCRVPVDLTAVARKALQALRQEEPARRVTVTVEDGLEVLGDARLLEVALTNLLGNAWKFTSQREDGEIVVGREAVEGPGPGDRIFVRDNGAGFDMAYAHKLFGAFQRLHTAREFPGTGVGLAIVQRVTARHGGRVWAEGAVGRGAKFSLELPRPESAS